MRKPELEDKIFKLLTSSCDDDILIALELMRDYEFQDLGDIPGMRWSETAERERKSMYMYDKPRDNNITRIRQTINDMEVDVWKTIVFFLKC